MIPTALFFRSALEDAAYALLHGEHARTERGAVLLDAVMERGITSLPERGTRPGPLLAAWLRRDRRRLREPVRATVRRARTGGSGGGGGARRVTPSTPSPRPAHVSPPTAADLRARLLWALERWLPPLPERRMPTMKRRNPSVLKWTNLTVGKPGSANYDPMYQGNAGTGYPYWSVDQNHRSGEWYARQHDNTDPSKRKSMDDIVVIGTFTTKEQAKKCAGSAAGKAGGLSARANPSRMADLRARLTAAQEGYAMLTRAHGSSVVGWQEYKRAVARMSPAAILAEARESAGTRSNPRAPKKEDRATKAVRRVTEAFKAGVILHWRGRTADGRRDDQGTAGYYRSGGRASHSTGTAEYAILGTPGRGGRDATFDTAFGAADHLVAWIGVTNAIDALKAAARKHGTEYANLDTPIRWAPKSNPRKRNPRAKLTKDQKKALADYNFAISQEDRYLGSVFVTPSGQRRVEAVTEAAYARCKALGMTHEHGL